MFQITIDDVITVRDITLVSGKCENRNDFTSKLIDDDGIEYSAHIPFIKYLVMPDLNYMTLELKDIETPNALKGRVLKSILQ